MNLTRAALCLNCEEVFDLDYYNQCPLCCSSHWWAMERWLEEQDDQEDE